MMTVFFDTDRPLLLDFKSYYDTINANRYCQMRGQLFAKVKYKHHGKVTNSINMLHDTANPHVFHRLQDNRCSQHSEILHISWTEHNVTNNRYTLSNTAGM